jgi:hypothetical protein
MIQESTIIRLPEILRKHKLWIETEGKEGECADLRGAYLEGVNLREANLHGANLYKAYLKDANLLGANLSRANLKGAYLMGANLHAVNFEGVNLQGASLQGANLKYAGIFSFQAGVDFGYSFNGRIKIGCHDYPIEYWLENYKQIGKAAKYTKEEIKLYGSIIKFISKKVN